MPSDFVTKPFKKQLNKQNPDTRLKAALQRTGARNSARVDDLAQIGINSNNASSTLPATAYPSEGFFEWRSELGELVALLIASHTIATSPVSAGPEVIGVAKEAGQIGAAFLEAYSDDTLATGSNMYILSDGRVYIDLSAASSDSLGIQKVTLIANTSGTNAINDILYMVTRSKGTVAAGLGTGVNYLIEDSAGNDQQAGDLAFKWVSPTNGSETAKLVAFATQGGTLYEHTLQLGKYIAAGNLSPGAVETTIFDQAVPANFLTGDNVLEWFFNWTITSTTNRSITIKVYFDDTLMITHAPHNTGTSTTSHAVFRGTFISTGSNAQRATLEEIFYNATAAAGNNYASVGTAAEADNAVKNIKVTATLGGAVTTSLATAILVQYNVATQ